MKAFSRSLFERMVSIGYDPIDPPEVRQIKRIWAGAMWVSPLSTVSNALGMYAQGFYVPAIGLALTTLLVFGILLTLRLRPSSYRYTVHAMCIGNTAVSVVISLSFGGLALSGTNMIWGFLTPMAAIVALGRGQAAKFWLGVYVAATIASSIIGNRLTPLYRMPDVETTLLINLILVALSIYIILNYFVRQRDEFQKKSDDLLRNILPESIAEQLKQRGGLIAERFDEASVLFADVVDFTPMSARLSPVALVTLLDEVFSEFDRLTAKHGLEKIKTIGDCYMVAAGVPQPRSDHAHALAALALDMQTLVQRRTFGGQPLRFRIGLNSGPLVAGVIGQRKFLYDLWGDAVNTASRMESHGSSGVIQITSETYERIRDAFTCTPRGTIQVKGKGTMDVYELVGSL